MSTVFASAAVSLDGFIADTDGEVGPLFDFYNNGTIETVGADPDRIFRMSAASAAYVREQWNRIGAVVIGRRLYDLTRGWGGRPPVGDAVFVVTHRPPDHPYHPESPFHFITAGLSAALERAAAAADDRAISLSGGTLTGLGLAAGLVDELAVSLVPVILGEGIRFVGDYAGQQILLDDPDVVIGDRVTHLHYRVRKNQGFGGRS